MKEPLLGAHISIAGGVHTALLAAKAIGASTLQIFTANQKQWASKTLDEDTIALFKQTLADTGLQYVMSHDSYLINLGSPKTDVREKSIRAFREEIQRCLSLGISFLNFHPGAALDSPRDVCLDAIIDALLSTTDLLDTRTHLRLLVENMAGQGSTVGSTFEEISYIIEGVKNKIPIGVCLDTCHLFAAGYDIRTKESLKQTLDTFDATVGLSHLYAMHLNDSVHELGSHLDRHELIGQGMIGENGFSAIMKEPRLAKIPKYLETPGGLEIWEKEIAWLKGQYKDPF